MLQRRSLSWLTKDKMMRSRLSRYIFLGMLFLLTTGTYSQNHWHILNSPTSKNLNKLYFLNNETGWVAGDQGLIMKTSDGGQNWTAQITNTASNIEEIFMLDEDYGWALGIQPPSENTKQYGTVILSTSDGGVTWSNYLYPNEFFLATFFIDSLNGWVGGEYGRLMGTTDGGVSWFPANVDSSIFSGFGIRNIEFLTPQYGYATGGHFDIVGVIWRTDNGGQSWSVQAVGPEPITDIHFIDSLNIIGVGGDFDLGSRIVTSSNGGISWQHTYLGIFGQANAIAFRTSAEAWSPLGFTGTLMFSQDSGQTWTDLYSPDSIPMYDAAFTDSVTGYMVGDYGTILKYNPIPTGINTGVGYLADEPFLFPNYPNPFNSTTTLQYKLSERAFVSLEIFDIGGSVVASLVNGIRDIGYHKIEFNASDLSSGIYFCRLKTVPSDGKNYTSNVSRMLLLK